MNKVLITGGEGFTGKAMIPYLQKCGFDVYATSKKYVNDNLLPCNILQLDSILSVLEKVKPDYVIHLASISSPSFVDIETMFNVNVFGTKNLLDALLVFSCNIKKLIIASSAYVYGSAVEDMPINEDVCVKPNSHYGNSKLAMETLVRLYFEKLPIVIVRPFNYTAPGHSSKYIIPKLVEHYRQRSAQIILGNVDIVRDFSDLEDVMYYYREILISSVDSEVINVCSGHGYSISQLILILDQLAGYKIKVVQDLALMRKVDFPVFIGDNSRMVSIIGSYQQKSIEYTLQRMLIKK